MKASTLFCAAAFLFLVTHGCFGPPRMFHRGMLHHGMFHSGLRAAALTESRGGSVASSAVGSSFDDLDRRIDRARNIVKKLERSERLVVQRIDEIRRSAAKEQRRRFGFRCSDGGEGAGMKILFRRLEEIRSERVLARETLERLKTERVAVAARRDVLETAAERRTLAGLTENKEPAPKGPVERLAEEGRGGGDGMDGGECGGTVAAPPGWIRYEVF